MQKKRIGETIFFIYKKWEKYFTWQTLVFANYTSLSNFFTVPDVRQLRPTL
jgi:hypothetical protein